MRVFASTQAVAGILALAFSLVAVADLASAKPTDAQLAAIKANCRSDFMSNCWGVPRGGAEAFQCLKDHLASLSAPCQQAVKVVIATATPPADSGTAATAAKPATETKPAAVTAEPAPAPSLAATENAATAAPGDAPSSGAATTQSGSTSNATSNEQSAPASNAKAGQGSSANAAALGANAAKMKAATSSSNAASQSVSGAATANSAASAASASKAKTAATQATAPVAPAATGASTPSALGFIPPRKKIMLARACRADFNAHCPDVDVGGGRAISCLEANKASLTPDCRDALTKLVR